MRPRFLGVLLVVLVVLGALNLVQAIRARLAPDTKMEVTVESEIDQAIEKELEESARTTDDVYLDRTFKVSEGQLLAIDVQHSDIDIETGDTDEAHVTVTVKAGSESRSRELFERMRFEAFQENGRVVLRSSPEDNWNWNGRFSIDVRAVIPKRFDLQVASTHGDVNIETINGSVVLETTHGDVSADWIEGPRIEIASTHGDFFADGLRADDIEVQTTHGEITVDVVDGGRFDALTTHSDVHVDEFSGTGEVTTTHGDVEIGVMKLGGMTVKTTHGDVLLIVPKGLGANVNLRGEHVSLPSVSSFDGSRQTEQAKGLLNGGGPTIDVSTTFGEVRLEGD